MKGIGRRVLGALLAVGWVAQALPQERPLQGFVSAGYSITNGTAHNYLQDGWIVSGGVRWIPQPDNPWALDLELHYSGYDATKNLVNLGRQVDTERIDSGDGSIFGVNTNLVYRMHTVWRGYAYLTAGIGEYWRTIRLSETVLVGGTYCDPWWGFCYPGVYPGQSVVHDHTTGRFAWNAGIGFDFPLSDAGSWFIDVRFHQMQTKTATEFIPIQVGFRF
jgi:Outer membrane protein beta-barrel domain